MSITLFGIGLLTISFSLASAQGNSIKSLDKNSASSRTTITDNIEHTYFSDTIISQPIDSFPRLDSTLSWNVTLTNATLRIPHGYLIETSYFKELQLHNCSGELLYLEQRLRNLGVDPKQREERTIYLDNSSIDQLAIVDSVYNLVIENGKFKKITILHADLRSFYIVAGRVDTMEFNNVSLFGGPHLFITVPKTLIFNRVDLSGLNDPIKLAPDRDQAYNIYIGDIVAPDKLEFDYSSNIKLHFLDSSNYEFLSSAYTLMLENYKRRGKLESYERLDKEFSEVKLLRIPIIGKAVNCISRLWWGYGYNKYLIVINALALHLLFVILNSFLFDKLVYHTYRLEKFVEVGMDIDAKYYDKPVQRYFARLPYTFLYTSYIFWGWKLDLNSVNIKRIGLFSIVLVEYLLGIISLAYLANLIITK